MVRRWGLLLCLLTLPQLCCAYRIWRPIGRGSSSRIRETAIHPTTDSTQLLIDDNGGLFRSDDGGENWVGRWHLLPTRVKAQGVAFSNHDPTTVLLTTTSGMYLSSDSGETWTHPTLPTNGGLLGLTKVASSLPHQNQTIYVGTGDWANSGSVVNPCVYSWYPGIYKSTDNGATWTLTVGSWTQLRCSSIEQLIVDPLDPNSVYFSTSMGRSAFDMAVTLNPLMLHSSDAGATWSADYLGDFSKPLERVTAMSFAANGQTLVMSYTGGSVLIGSRAQHGQDWTIRELAPANPYAYYDSLLVVTQIGHNSTTVTNSTYHSVYASVVNSSFSGLQIATVNGSFQTPLTTVTWSRMANTWQAQTTGWNSSAWRISSIQASVSDIQSHVNPRLWITDETRLYTAPYPYLSWNERYSSKPVKRNSWTSRGFDMHSFTHAVTSLDDSSQLLLGSSSEVALASVDGGYTFTSEKRAISDASFASGGPASLIVSSAMIATSTNPSMTLMYCSATDNVTDVDGTVALMLRRNNRYYWLNASQLLQGPATLSTTGDPDQILLSTLGQVFLLSGFKSIADGTSLEFQHTVVGHSVAVPSIISGVWNISLNNTAQGNISMPGNNPYYFGSAGCDSVVAMARCPSCTSSTPQSLVLCENMVYQYSEIAQTVTNEVGYSRQEHWAESQHCHPWKWGQSQGINCVDFTSTRDSWQPYFGGWTGGGQRYTVYEDFKHVFHAESGRADVAATMFILTNSSAHIQRADMSWRVFILIDTVTVDLGWPGTELEFTAAASLPDATHGYRLILAVAPQTLIIGEDDLQATRIVSVTAVESASTFQLVTTMIDETEGLSPIHTTKLMTLPNSNGKYMYATSSQGAWVWDNTNMVSAGTDLASWSGASLVDAARAFGNYSMQVGSEISSTEISATSSEMYRVRGWAKGNCTVRVVPLPRLNAVMPPHLMHNLQMVAGGSWIPFKLEFSISEASNRFQLKFQKAADAQHCYVDHVWLGTVSEDLYGDLDSDSPARLQVSRVLPQASPPALVGTTSNHITFSWSPPAGFETYEGITNYQAEYRVKTDYDTNPYISVTEFSSSVTSYTLTDLVPGVAYQIRIKSKNAVGYSVPSDPLLAECNPVVPGAPGVPSIVNSATATEIMLTWTAPTYDGASPITGYQVYVNDPLASTPRAPILFSNTIGTVTGLSPENVYTFRVTALNIVGESPQSPTSAFLPTESSTLGICNVTMKFLKSLTILEYPYGAHGNPSTWKQLFSLDVTSSLAVENERVDSVDVYTIPNPKDVNNPTTYVTYNLKKSLNPEGISLAAVKDLLLKLLVDVNSQLHQGVTTGSLDTRFLTYDGADPGTYEARRALGGSSSRLDEGVMQIIGVILFLIIPSLWLMSHFAKNHLARQEKLRSYRDKFDR